MLALTFDIDWAPDWCIADCTDLLARYGVPATFYITHDSPALRDLQCDMRHECGIHPNFLPGSSHGDDARDVLDTCLTLVPHARSMRSHALVQSTHLLSLLGDHYPQIDTEMSLLLPLHDGLRPTCTYFGAARRRIVRLPFFWEDDVMAEWPEWRWDSAIPHGEGLRIYNFHPVFLALNIGDLDGYRAFKRHMGDRPFQHASRAELARFRNNGCGAADFFQRLVGSDGAFQTISAIADRYRRGFDQD